MAIQKTTIPCADVKMFTQETLMKVGETRKGALTMHDECRLQFDEQLPERCERNPTVWSGRYFNVHKNRQGEYVISFRRLLLTSTLDPSVFADTIFLDVESVKKEFAL